MNKFKKISTLFALAVISQCSYAQPVYHYPSLSRTLNIDKSPHGNFSDKAVYNNSQLSGARGSMYTPNTQNIYSDSGYVKSALQNVLQNANVTNTADFQNNIDLDGLEGSDFVNNLTNNTTAMSSNVGSSYNNSTNNITTKTENNSTNDYTTTLDKSHDYYDTGTPNDQNNTVAYTDGTFTLYHESPSN
jgi:hypothetical protein